MKGETNKEGFVFILQPEGASTGEGELNNNVASLVQFFAPKVGCQAGNKEDMIDKGAFMLRIYQFLYGNISSSGRWTKE
jgi:hypothetical protein